MKRFEYWLWHKAGALAFFAVWGSVMVVIAAVLWTVVVTIAAACE